MKGLEKGGWEVKGEYYTVESLCVDLVWARLGALAGLQERQGLVMSRLRLLSATWLQIYLKGTK
jgi:hypothetical protein